jgi:transcriptional regulator with XRE-family HTH domain
MPNVKDCPGFETFGADVQQAREAVKMSRRELAEKVGIDPRYLANIELCGTIPSVPVVMQLIRICKLPAERYFNPELLREDSEQRQRTKATNYSFARRSICPLWKVSLTEPSN